MPEIKVLFVTSEVAPLIKTGGLADVSGALPAALRTLNIDVRVLVPGYPQVLAQMGPNEVVASFPEIPGFPASKLIFSIMKNGVPLLVLDCPVLYQRMGGPYSDPTGHDWVDNPVRFGLLSKIAAVLGSKESPLSWRPDLVHGNDWQAGLIGVYLSVAAGAVPNVITIHNLAFQGNFRPRKVQLLQLPPECFDVNGIELYGNMSFLKAGIYYAYHITTVSPNYAREIQGDELGFGLQGLLRSRSSDVTGILNGIDTEEWNPETDKHLTSHFSVTRMTGKAENKQALQTRMTPPTWRPVWPAAAPPTARHRIGELESSTAAAQGGRAPRPRSGAGAGTRPGRAPRRQPKAGGPRTRSLRSSRSGRRVRSRDPRSGHCAFSVA